MCEHLLQENHHLAACMEQLERPIGVFGLPVEEEGKDLGGFLEDWFPTFCTSTPVRSLL